MHKGKYYRIKMYPSVKLDRIKFVQLTITIILNIYMSTIYVIDDEPLILEVIQLFLQSQGYTVYSFGSPFDINIATMIQSCDLLICDVQLGQRKDGLDYCTEWIEQGLRSPILIISGFMENPDTFRQEWNLLKKPFNRRQLITEVENLLS